MKIAVDTVDGDNAPQATVEGVMLAKQDFPDIEFQLYGKEAEIRKYIADEKNITIIHTGEKIASDDEPIKAIHRKKTASMVLTARAVKSKEAGAIFSADSIGALLAAGLFIVGRIKSVERPGLMPTLPVMGEPDKGFNMLNLGVNADNKLEHLAQYTVLGSFYVEKVRNVQSLHVGLLNNETEEAKDSELAKKAFELLAADETISFVGNAGARELLNGITDMVATGGFTGNTVLKSIKSAAMNMMSLLRTAILSEGVKGKMGASSLKNVLHDVKDETDYSKHGGAVLLGLKAPVIKTHGTMGPNTAHYTVRQVRTMLETRVIP